MCSVCLKSGRPKAEKGVRQAELGGNGCIVKMKSKIKGLYNRKDGGATPPQERQKAAADLKGAP